MPDSYGKRQRNAKKARKFAEREERRLARKQERADREAGVLPDDGPAEGLEEGLDGEAMEGSDEAAGAEAAPHDEPDADPEPGPDDEA